MTTLIAFQMDERASISQLMSGKMLAKSYSCSSRLMACKSCDDFGYTHDAAAHVGVESRERAI